MSFEAVALLCVLVAVVLLAPRRWALLAMIAGVLYLTHGQVINVMGLNLYPHRFLELAGFGRVILRSEFPLSRFNNVDRALVLAYGYAMTVFVARTVLDYGTSPHIAQVTTLAKVGTMVDVALSYFAFRGLVANIDDLRFLLRRLVLLLIPYVILLAWERHTGDNPFSIVGGIPKVWIDSGRVRCHGSFMHPSLLGTLGASFLPLYFGLALDRNHRAIALAGLLLCMAVVLFANSGGPLTFVAVSAVAWMLWPMRSSMWVVRVGIVGALVVLIIYMNAPIWYLPARMSDLVGGGGWHRSYLMDQAARHIDQWWIAGMPLDLTIEWFPYHVLGAADITNQYLIIGFDAGIVAILLFLWLQVRAFQSIGLGLKATRPYPPRRTENQCLIWGLGAMLAGHLANFLAISYFDQTNLIWLLGIASIAGARAHARLRKGGLSGRTSIEGEARDARVPATRRA